MIFSQVTKPQEDEKDDELSTRHYGLSNSVLAITSNRLTGVGQRTIHEACMTQQQCISAINVISDRRPKTSTRHYY